MVPLDLKALSDRADRIIYGTVESSESHWTSDHDAIYTDVAVRVSRSYKGGVKPGELMMVRREGGNIDKIGMKVFGAAGFTVGEEVVVFVEKRGIASWVVGMAQGKLRVVTEADGSKKVSAPDIRGIDFLKSAAPVAPLRARSLDEFESDLQTLVKGAK